MCHDATSIMDEYEVNKIPALAPPTSESRGSGHRALIAAQQAHPTALPEASTESKGKAPEMATDLDESEILRGYAGNTYRFVRPELPPDTCSWVVQLGCDSVAMLMQNCGVFMLYWECRNAKMSPEFVEGRYGGIAQLVTTSLPWDPDQIAYEDLFTLGIEAFDGIDVLYATYHGDLQRLGSAIAVIDLDLGEDVMHTALYLAACQGDTTTVDFLLSSGICRIDWKATDGTTCLHMAATYNFPQVVALLLDKKADPNVRCQNGETAFFKICASKDHDEICSLLTRGGAALNIPNAKGTSALCQAAGAGNFEATETMISRGMDPSDGTLCDWCPLHKTGEDAYMEGRLTELTL
ncbi:ankyrin repeat-containing domain protein [Whalleya microplaca]|nr:ankyrin repeat-containing domain protein [Whalleya microplaca]